jgi:NAD+ diphosphatase
VSAQRPFQLSTQPHLSRSRAQRDEAVRVDAARTAELWRRGRVLLLDARGRTAVRADGTGLADRPAEEFGEDPPADAVLLGEHAGTGYWALPANIQDQQEGIAPPVDMWGIWRGARSPDGLEWHDLRAIGALLDDNAAGLLTTAVALRFWHTRAGFCARCGTSTGIANAGWARRCAGCGHEEYPRTDPAVICLVHDEVGTNGEQVLLARGRDWSPDRFSLLAGFVEAGESLESCVVREINEEVGLDVTGVRYLGSQPWPFPRSIMIGFAARADRSVPVKLADGEIEQARWVPREQVRAALATSGGIDGLMLPGPTSIASQMLAGWAAVS